MTGGFVGAAVGGLSAGCVADMVSDGVLGVDDSAFVQSVYHRVVLELQSQYGLSQNRVSQLRSRLQTETMDKELIKDGELAFHTALKAGQQMLQED